MNRTPSNPGRFSPLRGQFREVRDPHTGAFLFRYAPGCGIVEIKQRGRTVQIDLKEFHPPELKATNE